MSQHAEEVRQLAEDFESSYQKAKVLVTGGAGFLGSWLSEALVACGASVHCLDNFSTGQIRNILNFRSKAKVIRADVTKAKLRPIYDHIFHMSSRASPEEYQRYPIETLAANSVGTTRMLELARRSDSVIVYASTSEVYGNASIVPTPESYYGYVSSVGVRSCYDEGKRFGEAACMAYFRQYGVHVRIPRIFNSYGPRIRSDGFYARVVPRFIVQALKGQPITIQGDGMQTRSFCYVTDTVRGLLLLGANSGNDGEALNVGSADEMAVLTLATKIKEASDSKSELKHVAAREDDPRRRCPDLKKITTLGWQPRIRLSEGLAKTIAYFKEVRHS